MDVKATTKNAEENALTIADLASLFTQQLETEEADHLEVPGPSIEAIRNGSAEGGPESLTQQVETEENDSCEVPGLSVETLRNDSTEESESLAQQVETEEIDTHEIPGPSTEAMALRNDSVDEKTVNQTAVEAKEIVETERTGTHEVPEPSTEALMNNNAEEEMANQGGIEIEDIVANVEISNDNHEEADDNDEKVCIGSASNVIEVNSDDDVEITGEEGESERDSEENEERESDEEECNGWDSWGMWDSYSDYYGSDKEFDGDENSENEHEDDDDVNDDVSGAAKDGENDRHADDNSGTYGLDSGDTEVDPQLAVEVDDVIAMDSVDLMAANIEDNNDVIAMDSVDLMAANIENNNDVIVVEDDQIDQR